MVKGFIAGSFDPLTYGHLDIILQACKVVSELYIGIGIHDMKTHLLSTKVRKEIIEKETSEFAKQEQCKIHVLSFDGLLVDTMRDLKATILFRGIRTAVDFDYEMQMVAMNRNLYPDLNVYFIPASGANAAVSSSLVKQVACMGGNVSSFIPPQSAMAIRQLKDEQN